jgi:hypothetical protein
VRSGGDLTCAINPRVQGNHNDKCTAAEVTVVGRFDITNLIRESDPGESGECTGGLASFVRRESDYPPGCVRAQKEDLGRLCYWVCH